MDFKEYQEKSKETAIYPRLNPSWIYPSLGLSGETGEVMEKLKKILRDSNNQDKEKRINDLKKELGDILWYLSQLSTELGFSLQEIAEENIEKLKSRKERGVLHGDGDSR
ncbi:MAG: nucleoside triphosphate pyrophosphohydrolase family protein [Candidatus Pacearchaeota archaeon]